LHIKEQELKHIGSIYSKIKVDKYLGQFFAMAVERPARSIGATEEVVWSTCGMQI